MGGDGMSLSYLYQTKGEAQAAAGVISADMGLPRVGRNAKTGQPQPKWQGTDHWDKPRQRRDTGQWYIARPRQKHAIHAHVSEYDAGLKGLVAVVGDHWTAEDWTHAYIYIKDAPLASLRSRMEEPQEWVHIGPPAYPMKANADGTFSRKRNILGMLRTDAVHHCAFRGEVGAAILQAITASPDAVIHLGKHIDFVEGRYPDHFTGNHIPYVEA